MRPQGPLIVNWGAGTNSTAMVVGLLERDIRPDLIIFSDTLAERRQTRDFVGEFRAWLAVRSLELVVVSHESPLYASLEAKCFHHGTLPSLAFGFKSCSSQWKRDPINKYTTHWAPFQEARRAGRKVVKALGYDIDERRRAGKTEDERHLFWHPLIEWGWGREECVSAIERAGMSQPGKSACYFCPASKKPEILALRDTDPDLFKRALEMEDNAKPNLDTVKGLGRRFSWREFVEEHDRAKCRPGYQLPMVSDDTDIPCDCYDGDSEDK